MAVSDAELIALQRSAVMLQPNANAAVSREQFLELVNELVETRRLLRRFGADLTTVARHSPRS